MPLSWIEKIGSFLQPVGDALNSGFNFLTSPFSHQKENAKLENISQKNILIPKEDIEHIFMGPEMDPILPDISSLNPRYQIKPNGDSQINELKHMIGKLPSQNQTLSADMKALLSNTKL